MGLGVWGGVGDWVGVSDWGWGGLNFIKEIPLKTNPTKFVKSFKTSKFDSKSPLVIVKLGVDFRKIPYLLCF